MNCKGKDSAKINSEINNKSVAKTDEGDNQSDIKQAVVKFNEDLYFIEKLIFSIGDYFEKNTVITITFYADKMAVKKEDMYQSKYVEDEIVVNKETRYNFIQKLQNLHLNEWKSRYDNLSGLDGTRWSLDLYFSNEQQTIHFDGSNAYPSNFDEFCRLMNLLAD